MRIRDLMVLVFVFAAFGLTVSAQGKAANFAGTWQLDVSRSKLGERSFIESQTITVTQTEKEITVQTATKRAARPADAPVREDRGGGRMGGGMGRRGGFGGGDTSFTYTLDGKETKTEVEGRMGKTPITLKAKADGSKLQLTSSSSFSGPMGDVTMTTKEKWELSADGKTLTVQVERSTPRGDESMTKVYTRAS